MKEIIYLDTELMNSYLAQLGSGLTEKTQTGQQVSHSDESGKEKSTSAKAGGELLIKLEGSKETTEKEKTVFSKENTELKELIMHDYSLDILLKKIDTKDITHHNKSGYCCLIKGNIDIYDFHQLKIISDPEVVSPFLAEDVTDTAGLKEVANMCHKLGILGDVLYPNTCLFKVQNALCLCDKANLRINQSILSLLNQTTRDIHLLGIVMFKANNSSNIEENIFRLYTHIMNELLSNMGIHQVDDYYIRPIALYFE
ncbi:hypothetical protein B8A46_05525 [Dolosigranulum pigrum]|uniref:DUF6414 family protein n=1 Tax=Dolosigranulum pigrum TaxID=29394 RepID=UPI000DBF6CCB|nr:hypothetical protein [Dolosigranulum pigrum]RAN59841.1 hypothetical protein B8A46_05525 [Dolosigranulum pigrum]